MRFAAKTAFVTGASSGIGRATATAFAREGGDVVLVGRNRDALQQTATAVHAHGQRAVVVSGDLTKASERTRMVNDAMAAVDGIDVLVNAAGVIATGTVENTRLEDFEAMFSLNTTAVFHLMQLLVAPLKERRGAIVNVSSVTGIRAFPGVLSYCASKAATDQLTRCAALELASAGVRVNAVCPGVVVTELHRRGGMDAARYADFLTHSEQTHPLGRVGQPDEVAKLILFLSSTDSGWITGVTLPIDGGRHLTCAR